MRTTRRSFWRSGLAAGAVAAIGRRAAAGEDLRATYARLDEVAAQPVLKVDQLEKPVRIARLELLRNRHSFLVRAHAADGAEGIGVPNAMHMVPTYPIFLNRVAPFFAGTY